MAAIMGRFSTATLLDDLIRPQQQRRRNGEAESLGGLEVDDELERTRLLDGQVAGFRAFEYLVNVRSGPSERLREVWRIRHESAEWAKLSLGVDRGQPGLRYHLDHPFRIGVEHPLVHDDEGLG